jgi:hypothetical protein
MQVKLTKISYIFIQDFVLFIGYSDYREIYIATEQSFLYICPTFYEKGKIILHSKTSIWHYFHREQKYGDICQHTMESV